MHTVHDLNPARISRVMASLQGLQDDPEILANSRQRFDANQPPPPYSPAEETEPPSPAFFFNRLKPEDNDLTSRPLDAEELNWFRKGFSGHRVSRRYQEESAREKQRIIRGYGTRDEWNRPNYRGPDLVGEAGNSRRDIMVRNSIRKRWEKLHVWNPDWGIPGRPDPRQMDMEGHWHWEWEMPVLPVVEQSDVSWPARDNEQVGARAIRQYLERKGQWSDDIVSTSTGSDKEVEPRIDPRETLITTRPWFQFKVEAGEEGKRLSRSRYIDLPNTEAEKNVKARWQACGEWKDTWPDTAGWKWRHESPSPEPEDFNNLDFSPSEVDALEMVDLKYPKPDDSPRESRPARVENLFGPEYDLGPSRPSRRVDTAEAAQRVGDDIGINQADSNASGKTDEDNPSVNLNQEAQSRSSANKRSWSDENEAPSDTLHPVAHPPSQQHSHQSKRARSTSASLVLSRDVETSPTNANAGLIAEVQRTNLRPKYDASKAKMSTETGIDNSTLELRRSSRLQARREASQGTKSNQPSKSKPKMKVTSSVRNRSTKPTAKANSKKSQSKTVQLPLPPKQSSKKSGTKSRKNEKK